jgi:hypothetical protein
MAKEASTGTERASATHGEGKNDFPFTDPISSCRDAMVRWAIWGIRHSALFDYTEGPGRMSMIHLMPGETARRISADCSGFATGCASWAGAPDPNSRDFDGEGYTGTMLDSCAHIPFADVRPGDLVVYGPGTGEHVCVVIGRVVKAGELVDLRLASHGREGDPRSVLYSVERKLHNPPARFLSFIS